VLSETSSRAELDPLVSRAVRLGSAECVKAGGGERRAEHQRVDLVGAFVGVDGLQV